MPNLSCKELTALEESLGAEQNLVKKFKALASLCNDEAIKQDLEHIASRHQQHANQLITFLQ